MWEAVQWVAMTVHIMSLNQVQRSLLRFEKQRALSVPVIARRLSPTVVVKGQLFSFRGQKGNWGIGGTCSPGITYWEPIFPQECLPLIPTGGRGKRSGHSHVWLPALHSQGSERRFMKATNHQQFLHLLIQKGSFCFLWNLLNQILPCSTLCLSH